MYWKQQWEAKLQKTSENGHTRGKKKCVDPASGAKVAGQSQRWQALGVPDPAAHTVEHLVLFFSVQRLHGFRQVVQHALLAVANNPHEKSSNVTDTSSWVKAVN